MRKRRDTDQPWPMDELHEAFIKALNSSEGQQTLPPAKLEKVIAELTKKTANGIERELIAQSPKMLFQRRKDHTKFEARNFRRWRPAFDLIETIWVCCEEMGRNFNQHFRPEAIQVQDFVFEAMTAIHAKSLLVAAEMICLMKGGFADAALTRWRTLYEFNVVATLITREGPQLALRYLAHADVQAAKDMESSDLVSDEELRKVKQRADYALAQLGNELNRHYGWACGVAGKKQPNFEDIERLAEKTEGRGLYKHASLHIHSNHRAYDELLGVAESTESLLLVGPSNSGMTGPLTLGAMTMVETTALYLATKPNFDRGIYTLVLLGMAQRLHRVAGKVEKRTLKAARKREAKVQET